MSELSCSDLYNWPIPVQVAENGSVILARFSSTYKCIKIWSYLSGNCVKFVWNPPLVTQTPISTSY